MKIRIAGTVPESIVDGPGIRFTLFVQGCPHHCEGCHNPQTHAFDGGTVSDTEEIIAQILANPYVHAVTFSGGEPMCQPEALALIATKLKEHHFNIIIYTGFTFEQLIEQGKKNPAIPALLRLTDTLIDGKFELSLKSLDIPFRGSKNQRILDVKQSLEQNQAVETKL